MYPLICVRRDFLSPFRKLSQVTEISTVSLYWMIKRVIVLLHKNLVIQPLPSNWSANQFVDNFSKYKWRPFPGGQENEIFALSSAEEEFIALSLAATENYGFNAYHSPFYQIMYFQKTIDILVRSEGKLNMSQKNASKTRKKTAT